MAGITKGPATVGRSHVRKETSKLPKDWEVVDPKHTPRDGSQESTDTEGALAGQPVAFVQGPVVSVP